MNMVSPIASSVDAPNRSVEVAGRSLAYRSFGQGPHLVLCLRFRGTMDSWDPLFLDLLAQSFTVTIFDYSGFGLSTGKPSYVRSALAGDVNDLVEALGLGKVVIGGWSVGGIAALTFAALHPQKVSHVLAIATMPPGPMAKRNEPIFLATAAHPVNSVEDEYILFFEPASATSRALGDASMARIATARAEPDLATPAEVFLGALPPPDGSNTPFPDPEGAQAAFFRSTSIPVLALCGDHDPMFPVENWHAVNDQWPSLVLVTLPDSGHGPQHQYPALSADLIAAFVRNTARS